MTLIVGIIARDAIVMGSDGQLTSGNHKEINRWKITCLPFANRSVLVAESGNASLSAQAVDYLKQKCIQQRVKDSEIVPNLVIDAVRHVRNHQMSLYPRQEYRPQEWKEFFMEHACFELTVAYYDHQVIPQLFSIDVSECVLQKAREHFITSGCGAELGQCLLSEHSQAQMPQDLAIAMAIHTIENVIRHDPYCGRPVRIGVLSRPGPTAEDMALGKEHGVLFDYDNCPGRVIIFSDPEASELAEIVRRADEETKEERNKKLLDIISERSAKKWEKMVAMFGTPPNIDGPPEFE